MPDDAHRLNWVNFRSVKYTCLSGRSPSEGSALLRTRVWEQIQEGSNEVCADHEVSAGGFMILVHSDVPARNA